MSEKRLTRHDIKKPDTFQTTMNRVFDWVRGHASSVVGIVLIVVLVAAGGLGYGYYAESKQEEARYQYARLAETLDQAVQAPEAERAERLKKVVGELEAYFENYRNTDAASLALVSVGDAYYRLNRFEEAANAFQKAAERFESQPSFKSMALMQAGKAWEAMRNYERALDYYQRANAVDVSPYASVLASDIGRVQVYLERNRVVREATAAAVSETTRP